MTALGADCGRYRHDGDGDLGGLGPAQRDGVHLPPRDVRPMPPQARGPCIPAWLFRLHEWNTRRSAAMKGRVERTEHFPIPFLAAEHREPSSRPEGGASRRDGERGYGKGLMPGPSPKRKERDESVDSSPRASKIMRHISPPPITRPGVQYESEDDKVFKGPKVVQLLRTIVKMHEEHKKLSDQVAELTLDLKSARDDYDTLRRGRGVKIERLEKKVGKGNQCSPLAPYVGLRRLQLIARRGATAHPPHTSSCSLSSSSLA
ncbi:hypothetical protein C2845_PM13G23020 [Panicum miliaceum]|uniref:Uncharacterized protein n=1 Tax=Panicum miliaceum TaxID=4540 RepID=A0A3L6RLV8_PANMI|nr:hypothetical protein C2845_PM13G23020 [Panicum miliaceum]